jgi:hypothetical protein
MLKPWVLPVLLLPAFAMAADDAKKDTGHSTRLGACSKEAHAKGLKGDERKKFISGCIASAKKPATAAPATHPAQ